MSAKPRVSIVMGSDSDLDILRESGGMTRSCPQPQTAEKAGRQRLQMIHALWNEAFSVAIVQQTIVGKALSSKGVYRSVAHDDAQFILSGFQE